jgi:acyl carrier protein
MADKAQITQLVYAGVDEVNQLLRKGERLDKAADTVISGEGSRLDSLGLVNLIFAVEQKVEQQLQVSVTIADEAALGSEQNPFRTLGSLTDHIVGLLEKQANG